MIRFEWINENNYSTCFNIRQKLFDLDFHSNTYEKVAKKQYIDKYYKIDYCIIKNENEESIGTIGYYISKSVIERCWIGWYGILPDFRGMHYGDQILNTYIAFIKENIKKARFLNVYTDFEESKAAIHGYLKQGMVLEEGKFYKDSHSDKWCILGMSLGEHKYEKWGKDPIWCED